MLYIARFFYSPLDRTRVILFLPPYSPELNPVEQVWDYLRSNYFSNRCYETIESVFDACCEAWELFSNQPALITLIGTRSWFI